MNEKPTVKLIGENGNAFVIIGLCKEAWFRESRTREEWGKIEKDMMSADYDHLLRVVHKHFNIIV